MFHISVQGGGDIYNITNSQTNKLQCETSPGVFTFSLFLLFFLSLALCLFFLNGAVCICVVGGGVSLEREWGSGLQS